MEEERVNGAHRADIAGLELIHQLNARLTSRAVQHSLGTRRRQTVKGQRTGRRERAGAQWLPVLWGERREDMLLVTLGRRFVSFCGRVHDASFGGEKHGKRRAARWQSRRVEREREGERERGDIVP